MLLRGASSAAYTYAGKVDLTGLDGIEGVTFKKKRGLVDPKLVELLHRAGVLRTIGSAVYLLSKPLEGGRKEVVLLLALGRHAVDDSARSGEPKIFQFAESHPCASLRERTPDDHDGNDEARAAFNCGLPGFSRA